MFPKHSRFLRYDSVWWKHSLANNVALFRGKGVLLFGFTISKYLFTGGFCNGTIVLFTDVWPVKMLKFTVYMLPYSCVSGGLKTESRATWEPGSSEQTPPIIVMCLPKLSSFWVWLSSNVEQRGGHLTYGRAPVTAGWREARGGAHQPFPGRNRPLAPRAAHTDGYASRPFWVHQGWKLKSGVLISILPTNRPCLSLGSGLIMWNGETCSPRQLQRLSPGGEHRCGRTIVAACPVVYTFGYTWVLSTNVAPTPGARTRQNLRYKPE